MKKVIQHIRIRLQHMGRTSLVAISVALVLLLLFYFALPKKLFHAPTCYVVEDADGLLLNASIAADGQWRFPYNEQVPQHFVDCITAFEDQRFFLHPGIDLSAMGRAAWANARRQGRQGGSTITMQVIRLAAQNDDRSYFNKFKETLLALRLEFSYSKKEIMALYASNAPFGGNVVGLDAAAWRYYGRSARQLSWGEMATLAVLPNAPSLVHPGRNRQTLLAKRNRLIDKLVATGKLSDMDGQLAKMENLPEKPLALPQLAPHLLQLYKNQTKKEKQGTRLVSTINRNLQTAVTDVLSQHHPFLKSNGINNMCALVLDVETGHALAYVGNIYRPGDKEMESDVDVIQARRSPGSALKPILYAAMLSDGALLPNSLVADVPTQIGGYMPENFDHNYDGAVPAHLALARSLNVPAVRLLRQYKYQRFYEVLKLYGIKTLNQPADFYGLSMILGGCEVKMWEMAGMYASLARILNHQQANKGIIDPTDIHAAVYNPGAQIKVPGKDASLPLDATSIYHCFQAMQEVMRPGEEGLWQQFSSSRKIAWKTGTSFGFRDAWAVGVTPKFVVAVWAGNTDGEGRADLVGVQAAAPVMFDIFRLLPNTNWFAEPQYNYVYVPVCRSSGYRAGMDCPVVDTLKMPPLAERSPLCNYHLVVNTDMSGSYRVNDGCLPPSQMQQQPWFVLPPVMEYYYRQNHHNYKPLPPLMAGCNDANAGSQIEIIYPQPDAKIYVPTEMSGEVGKTIFRATHKSSQAKIFWSVDNSFEGTTEHFHQLAMNPPIGKHTLTLTDANGNSVTRHFEVVGKSK